MVGSDGYDCPCDLAFDETLKVRCGCFGVFNLRNDGLKTGMFAGLANILLENRDGTL